MQIMLWFDLDTSNISLSQFLKMSWSKHILFLLLLFNLDGQISYLFIRILYCCSENEAQYESYYVLIMHRMKCSTLTVFQMWILRSFERDLGKICTFMTFQWKNSFYISPFLLFWVNIEMSFLTLVFLCPHQSSSRSLASYFTDLGDWFRRLIPWVPILGIRFT